MPNGAKGISPPAFLRRGPRLRQIVGRLHGIHMCALPMPPASSANANFAESRAFPLSTAPRDCRAQPNLRAASHCVHPSAAKSSRSTSPGCAWSTIRTLSSAVAPINLPLPSVVIDKININCLARIKAERDEPVSRSPRTQFPQAAAAPCVSSRITGAKIAIGHRASCIGALMHPHASLMYTVSMAHPLTRHTLHIPVGLGRQSFMGLSVVPERHRKAARRQPPAYRSEKWARLTRAGQCAPRVNASVIIPSCNAQHACVLRRPHGWQFGAADRG